MAINYVYGLGGRDFTVEDAKAVFEELREGAESGKPIRQYQYVGLRG
jgi:pyruvate ferredoxin oxidoreductase alpha subunit